MLSSPLRFLLPASAGLAALLAACDTTDNGPEKPGVGAARLEELLFNPKWYRTFDSGQSLDPYQGSFIFAWTYRDSMRHPDSFQLVIDTLWALPQDLHGDTTNDWDLDMCPAGFCVGGLREGISQWNISVPFAASGPEVDTFFAEHHFQFTHALTATEPFRPDAPDSAIFGGMMLVRSRSGSSRTDTVFGFGAWKMEWDTAFLPPVRPVNGYVPRRVDFKIVDGKVRYQPSLP